MRSALAVTLLLLAGCATDAPAPEPQAMPAEAAQEPVIAPQPPASDVAVTPGTWVNQTYQLEVLQATPYGLFFGNNANCVMFETDELSAVLGGEVRLNWTPQWPTTDTLDFYMDEMFSEAERFVHVPDVAPGFTYPIPAFNVTGGPIAFVVEAPELEFVAPGQAATMDIDLRLEGTAEGQIRGCTFSPNPLD